LFRQPGAKLRGRGGPRRRRNFMQRGADLLAQVGFGIGERCSHGEG